MLALRYYDSKMNMIYSLEELRSQYASDLPHQISFDEWINEMIETEILIPIN